MDFLIKMDKAKGYAIALPSDISAARFETVENGKLWKGFAGTVYGQTVATASGHKFNTFEEARENAQLFVEQCRTIAGQTPPVPESPSQA